MTQGSVPPARQPLTDRDQAMLAFERQWWKYPGVKEDEIRRRFGMTAVGYYQALNALLDRPEALAHDPMLVNRLRRMREARGQRRTDPTANRLTGKVLPTQ